MAASDPGALFPRIALFDAAGRPAPIPAGERLFAFFHTDCPTSEMCLPYLERIRTIGAGGSLHVLGVSQDDPAATEELCSRAGFGADSLFDPRPWRASETLGLEGIPTFFLVADDGRIRERVTGFEKAKMEAFAARAAELAGRDGRPLFSPGESVPAIRPG